MLRSEVIQNRKQGWRKKKFLTVQEENIFRFKGEELRTSSKSRMSNSKVNSSQTSNIRVGSWQKKIIMNVHSNRYKCWANAKITKGNDDCVLYASVWNLLIILTSLMIGRRQQLVSRTCVEYKRSFWSNHHVLLIRLSCCIH